MIGGFSLFHIKGTVKQADRLMVHCHDMEGSQVPWLELEGSTLSFNPENVVET